MRNGTKSQSPNHFERHADLLPAWLEANGYGPPPDIETRKLFLTIFEDEKANQKFKGEHTLLDWADIIRSANADDKTKLTWLKGARFGDKLSEKNSFRTNENVEALTAIVVEHDKGTIPFDEALAIVLKANLRGLGYTSPSYEKVTKERWRFIFPLSKDNPPERHEILVAYVNGIFKGALAGESFTLSQAYYFGSVNNPQHRVKVIDGDFLDVADRLFAGRIFKDGKEEPTPQTPHPDEEPEPSATDKDLNFLEARLPENLRDEIQIDAEVGKRSEQFHHAVKWLKDEGVSLADVIALLKKYPDGIANKYGKRVATEAKRVYGKPDKESPKDKDDAGTADAKTKPKLILSSEEFTRDFKPPDYLLDGVLLSGFVYSFTARTGDGKTAVALSLSASIALGKDFAGHEVAQGRVLYFAGENPDDVRMRWIAMAEHKNFDADTVDVHFISGTFDIAKLEKKIRDEVDALGGVAFVVIDTGPAYFQGDNENDNVEMIEHAQMLRRLKDLPGSPTVLAATHPTKNAGNDNLQPRGGGGFLNAMDGNLSAHKDDMLVKMHHQGKFRGIDFEPMMFELTPVTARKLVDSKGRHIPTVIAVDLSKEEQGKRASELHDDEDAILIFLKDRKTPTSATDIAFGVEWLTPKKQPNKAKAQRVVKKLANAKLVDIDRDGAILTKKGEAAAERAAERVKTKETSGANFEQADWQARAKARKQQDESATKNSGSDDE
jgi:hypothetical protein